MYRRELFPFLAAVPGIGLLLPVSLSGNRVPENIRKKIGTLYRPEYGEALEWNQGAYNLGFATQQHWLDAMPHHIDYLHVRAKLCLPPGYHYEIRSKVVRNHAINLGVAWYNNPSINKEDLYDAREYPGDIQTLGGFFLMGRFKV